MAHMQLQAVVCSYWCNSQHCCSGARICKVDVLCHALPCWAKWLCCAVLCCAVLCCAMPCYASECCEASRPAENKLCLLQHSVSPLQLTWLLALGALLPAVPCTSPGCWLLALEALLPTMAPTAAWLLWHKVRRAGNQPCMSPDLTC